MADRFELRLGDVEQKIHVEITGEDEVVAVLETLKRELEKVNLHEFYKSERALIADVTEAYRQFEREQSSATAKSLMININALTARAGKSIEEVFGSEYDAMKKTLEMAKDVAGAIGSGYSETAFKQMFFTLDKFGEKVDNVQEVFSNIANSSQVERLNEQVDELSGALSDARSEIEMLQSELERLRDNNGLKKLDDITRKSFAEFRAFLTSNNIDASMLAENEKYKEIIRSLVQGTITAGEAIAKFKKEFSGLLSTDASAGADAVLSKFEIMAASIEEIRSKMQGTAGSMRGGIIDNEEADRDTASIERESKAVEGFVGQSKGVVDITALIDALVEAGKNATGETSNLYESILPVVQVVRDLSDVDTNKLRSLAGIFEGFAGLNGFKVSSQQTENLKSLLNVVSTAGDLGNLTKLSGVKLDGISNLKVSKATVDNLERLVPLLDSLSHINSGDLGKIAGIDYSRLDQIKVPEVSESSLSSIRNMTESLNTMKSTLTGLRDELDLTGKAVTQSSQKMANAGISHAQIEGILKSGLKGDNADTAGMALQHVGVRKEDADRVISILREMSAPITDVATSWQKSEDAANDYLTVVLKASESGKEIQKSLTFKPVEEEVDGVTESYLKMIERGKEHLNLKKQEAEASKKVEEEQRELNRIADAWEKHKRATEWTDIDKEDAKKTEYLDEYIASLQKAREEEEALAESSWRSDADEMEAAEENALNIELERARESVAREREALGEEIGKAREERAAQLQRIQEESLKAAEKTRIEEERQAASQAEANRKAEESAAKRAVAADQAAEKERQANQKAADDYEAAEKRKQAASEMTAEQAEAELTRLRSLRIDYQNQIDRAGELGIDSNTVDRLREQVAGIDRMTPILEGIASKQSDMTLGMNDYKDAIKRAKDELALLKKQLSGEIKTAGTFTPMNDVQVQTALHTIGAKQTRLREQVQNAIGYGIRDTGEVQALQSLIPLYDELGDLVKAGAISQKDYNEQMMLFESIAGEAGAAIKPEIQAQDEIDAAMEKYKSLKEAMVSARGEWDMLPDTEKAELDDLIASYDKLNKIWADGRISTEIYSGIMGGISKKFDELNDEVKEGAVDAHSFKAGTTEYYDALIRANSAISRGSKALNEYTAAEHSKNDESREGYKIIAAAVGGHRTLEQRIRDHTISVEEARKQQKQYDDQLELGTRMVVANGDAHLSAFGKIGRAVKTHLTTLTATSIIGSVIREARQMVTTVTEIDTAMTELRKVTDETEARYTKFLENSATRAKNLSATISDTVTATADFARLGLSIDQAEIAADAAIVYKAVGDDINTIDDAAQSIISTMKAFNIQAEDSMTIVDKFNEVGNRFAISSGGLGDALMRSASAMQAANNTLDETIGLATAANTILQNPQSVGTTLKTVSMYVRAAKTELEAAGEETDGIAESTGKLRDLIMQITREGGKAVDIMADDHTFKSTYQILEEISKVWDKLSDANQAALLEKLGGKRNANAIAAILENFEIAQQAMEAASGASEGIGSAMAELDKYQQSIEGHMVRFKTAYQELANTLINGDLVKFVVDFGRIVLQLLTGLTKLVNVFGGLRSVLIMFGGAVISNIVSKIQKLKKGTDELSSGIGKLIQSIYKAIQSGEGFESMLSKIGNYLASAPGKIMMVTAAIALAVQAYQTAKQQERERRDAAIQAGEAANAESEEITSLYKQYHELSEKYKEDKSVKGDLDDITEQLIDKLGVEKTKVDKLAESYGNLDYAINHLTLQELRKNQVDLTSAYENAAKDVEDLAKGFEGLSNTYLTESIRYMAALDWNDNIAQHLLGSGLIDSTTSHFADMSSAQSIYNTYERIRDILSDLNKMPSDIFGLEQITDFFTEEYNYLSSNDVIKTYESASKALNDNLIQQGLIQAKNVDDFSKVREEIIQSVKQNRVYAGSIEDITAAVDDLLSRDERFAKFYETGAEDTVSNKGSIFNPKAISEVVDETQKLYSLMESAQKEMDDNGSLSSDTIKQIVDQMDDYTKYLTIENGLVKLNAEAWREYASSILRDNIVGTKEEIARLQAERSEEETKLAELRARAALAPSTQKASKIASLAATPEFGMSAGNYDAQVSEKNAKAIEETEAAVASYDDQIQKLNSDLEINKAIYKDMIGESSAAFDGTTDEIARLRGEVDKITSRNQELKETLEDIEYHKELIAEANEKLASPDETVFGNIDTNNRQVLEWTKENLKAYRDELESWGYTTEEIQQMAGDISTVLGGSEWFQTMPNGNGVEIAFSPILQTDSGPILLSADTIREYINALIDKINTIPGSNIADLFYFDTLGLEMDGRIIRNILAGIGDDAIRVGEAMHFSGQDGAIRASYNNLEKRAKKLGVTVEELLENFGDYHAELEAGETQVAEYTRIINELEQSMEDLGDTLNVTQEINKYRNQIKILTDAWTEFQHNGQISTDTYKELNKQFQGESGLVEIVNGKLSLNADAVEKLNTKLRDEYGLKIALAGASEEEIAYIDSLAAAMENLSTKTEDPTSDLKELTEVLGDMREGVELSTFDTLELIQKYPQLRDKIIATANGYKIEESAIRDLIKVKSQLLTLNEREAGISSARAALVTRAGGEQTAAKVDKIFAEFEAANGKAITSVKEFAQAYFEETGSVYRTGSEAQGAVFTEYAKYVNALIDLNNGLEVDAGALAMIVDDLNNTVKEGYDPSKESSSSSSAEKEETAFERAYKAHQHYLAMDRETVEQYLNWLDGAYKASYAAGEMELDDYYKYEEEVYEKRKELFQTHLDEMQHRVDLLSHQTKDTSEEQIAIYEAMQNELNAQANRYRARGIKDNDALIRELQNQWWQYEENIRQLREGAFNDWVSDRKFVIDQLKLDDADTGEIIGSWKEILERITSELEYYSGKGYDITTDVVQSLLGEMQSAKEAMIAALDEVVQKANEVVDGFENVYKTLTDAAKEYASSGYLSVDSLQAILNLGPKYLDMLTDENGQLVINEDRLQKVIAARTEEMAAETALSYAKQILLATEQDDTRALKELTDVQAASSASTWDMAYATLGYAKALAASKGMSTEFYDNAVSYVTKMQSVTKTAVDSVSAYYDTLKDGYVSQAEGLETILKLTEDMIKQENSDRIDELEKEKDLYKDIIDEKKEILRITKEQEDHDRSTADKLKEIADLQSKIDQLALDDSREAQAQRAKLEAELYEKQRALADDQADYAYDAQTEALDKQYEEYEKEKDDEIDALKDMLSSAEKLYRAAIDRISNGWDTLYDDLLNWNYQYGSTLEKDLTSAWKAAQAAAERYGSFVNAMSGVKDNTNLGNTAYTPDSEAVRNAVSIGSAQFGGAQGIIDKMRSNSIAWFTGDQAFLAGENQRLANDYKAATGKTLDYRNGLWYEEGSSKPIYNLADDQTTRNQIGNAVVAAMKANSELWKSADRSTKDDLERRNEDLAAKLANFLGKPITKTKAGVWMLGDTPLYSVTKFHSGGIAGGGTLKQNEIMALLKKGEAVIDEKREQGLYHVVDFVQILSDKLGKAIDSGRIASLLNGTAPVFRNLGTPALAGGIGTMNFSPTVNVTIAGAGDLSESTARKYGNIAAESVLEQLKGAFSQRGVSGVGNSILK